MYVNNFIRKLARQFILSVLGRYITKYEVKNTCMKTAQRMSKYSDENSKDCKNVETSLQQFYAI